MTVLPVFVAPDFAPKVQAYLEEQGGRAALFLEIARILHGIIPA